MSGIINNFRESFHHPLQKIEVLLGTRRDAVNDIDFHYFSKQNLPEGEPVRIIVRYYLTNSTILTWETTYVNNTLYIEVPHGCLPDASKDAFVALLEYAEEVLLCNNAIVYFSKEREDRGTF